MNVEKIDKLQVAARQLREAILLFFEQRDPVAIHTLAAPAHQILVDLAAAAGLPNLKANPVVPSDKKKALVNLINQAPNFLKHADRDPDGVLEFRPAMSRFILFDAVQLYWQLAKELPHAQGIFLGWFIVEYPDAFGGPLKEAVLKALPSGIDPKDFDVVRAAILSCP